METDNSTSQSVEAPDMDFKLRRRVAKKVLSDIQDQVDDIQQQVNNEKKASRFVIPGLVIFTLLIVLIWMKPDWLRSLSALF